MKLEKLEKKIKKKTKEFKLTQNPKTKTGLDALKTEYKSTKKELLQQLSNTIIEEKKALEKLKENAETSLDAQSLLKEEKIDELLKDYEDFKKPFTKVPKALIKKPSPLKMAKSVAINAAAIALSTVMTFSVLNAIVYYRPSHKLPPVSEVREKLQALYNTDPSNLYYGGILNSLSRFPMPKNQDEVKVVLNYDAPEHDYELFEYALSQYNYIFSVINPNYKFKVIRNPSEYEKIDPMTIKVSIGNLPHLIGGVCLSPPTETGAIDGFENTTYGIIFSKNFLNYSDVLKIDAIRHEFMHALGFKDISYLDESLKKNANPDSILNYKETTNGSLSSFDVACIDAMYRDPDNKFSDKEISKFVKNFDKNNPFSCDLYVYNKSQELFASVLQSEKIKDQLKAMPNLTAQDIENITTVAPKDINRPKDTDVFSVCCKKADTYIYYNVSIDKDASEIVFHDRTIWTDYQNQQLLQNDKEYKIPIGEKGKFFRTIFDFTPENCTISNPKIFYLKVGDYFIVLATDNDNNFEIVGNVMKICEKQTDFSAEAQQLAENLNNLSLN